jgi:hypothetical protein
MRSLVAHGMQANRRNHPLVLVLGLEPASTARVIDLSRGQGAVVARVRDDAGCLRVATAVGPDIILVDTTASSRLLKLLAAHPASAWSGCLKLLRRN